MEPGLPELHDFIVAMRWPNGVTCQHCGSKHVTDLHGTEAALPLLPEASGQQFSLRTGTVVADSRIGLDKWIVAIWMIVNSKNGISSYEIHRALGVSQPTAWFLGRRVRFALPPRLVREDAGRRGGGRRDFYWWQSTQHAQ